LSPAWSITPQAQLTYSRVDFDDFNDAFGAAVRLEKGGKSLLGRLGISLDYENSCQNDKGLLNRAHVYAIANLYKEFEGSTRVNVSGVSFASDKDDLWGGIGVGGSYNWDDDKFSVYGEALVATSLDNFGDSYSLNSHPPA
jgi:outer membrane autotransporter protein